MTAFELIEHTLSASGLPGPADFEEGVWLDCWPGFETGHFLDGFGHADKKFHFRADWPALGSDYAPLPAFPDHVAVIDDGDSERPFRLIPAPSRSFLNTSFNNMPAGIAREGRPTAWYTPEARRARARSDRIRIGTIRAASSSTPAPLMECSLGSSSSRLPNRLRGGSGSIC